MADRIAQAMTEACLTQPDLVRATGISRQLINDYVKGNKGPGVRNLAVIAQATGKPLEFFSSTKEDDTPRRKRAAKLPPAAADRESPADVLSQMMDVLQGLQQERLALLEEVRSSRLERQAFLEELQATRDERKRWRRLIAHQQKAQPDELAQLRAENEILKARTRALEGELSAPPVPGSGGVREAAG